MQPVGNARIVAFTEFIPEGGGHGRISQAGQDFTIIGENVAVVLNDDFALRPGENVAIGHPTGSAFSGLADLHLVPNKKIEQLLNPGAVIPDHRYFLGQN